MPVNMSMWRTIDGSTLPSRGVTDGHPGEK
jgi:hypothetical protein